MKIYTDVEQGSGDWFKLRLGIPTASCFDKIVTPKKCELSKSSVSYALKLVAEKLLNCPSESIDGVMYMERGQELEPQAVRQYEFTNDVQTVKVGFITTDDGSMGCSPDRLVVAEQRIALEVKCPAPHVHLGYLVNGSADEYTPQVQGQILIAELDRADLYAFHPRMPPALIRTYRDMEYIRKLEAALVAFRDLLGDLTERAKALGVYQAFEQARSPMELAAAQELDQQMRGDADMIYRHGFA